MKSLLFISFFFLSAVSFSQTLPELILDYEAYCNETLTIFIDQEATICFNDPISSTGNSVVYQKVDTIWHSGCPEYKDVTPEYEKRANCSPSRGYAFASIVSDTNVIRFISGSDIPAYSLGYTKTITMKKECTVKRRNIVPFSEHFWEWAKNRNSKH